MDRRESLTLLAGAVGSLAGCSGFASSSTSSGSESLAGQETVTDGPSSGTTTDPEMLLVRADTDRQPVWLADPNSEGGGRPTPRHDGRHIESEVVDSQNRAARLTVDAEVDDTQVASFLQATDFGSETVFVETIRVKQCFRLNLCRISWQAEKVSTDYVRQSLPWDEQCTVGEWVFEARLVRIPDTIDADDISAGSTSVGTGACHQGNARGRAAGDGGSSPSTPVDTVSETLTETNTATGGESDE